MEPTNLGYSTKNIPIPSKGSYLRKFIQKTEAFCRRMRWKAFFYLNPECRGDNLNTFGFKTRKTPPNIPELREFERMMECMIRNIRFKKNSLNFQSLMKKDITDIKNSSKVLVQADKTSNYYWMKPDDYTNLLHNNITKDYKKAHLHDITETNKEAKLITRKLGIDDRVQKTAEMEAFITLKDHKPGFRSNPSCRLINPTKSEIGRISKQLTDNINRKLLEASNVHLWRSTDDTLHWFKSIRKTRNISFITFDIVSFYPSISSNLLNSALDFASRLIEINEDQRNTIMLAKRSYLVNPEGYWIKRGQEDMFDVTMGSYDGAETCELVAIYMLHEINRKIGQNFGLYRDDGLGAIRGTPREVEQTKKKLCAVFREFGLSITVSANLKIVDFLDVTLDISAGTYKPFIKPNNQPLYVHKDSNHPPRIINNIPKSINERLNKISSNQVYFDRAANVYQPALRSSGYMHQLKYEDTDRPYGKRRNRRKEVTWFNPPYSKNVATNIGHHFFNIIDKCFPTGHKLNKIFNRRCVKLSYSCMKNIGQIISAHNRKIVNAASGRTENHAGCNCRKKTSCPLNGKCLSASVVYQATVKQESGHMETYVGLTENSFKTRWNNHKSSFTNSANRNATELSKFVWTLKDRKVHFDISWRILKYCNSYNRTTKSCMLCLNEKLIITRFTNLASLNKRNELVSCCRHAAKHFLNSSVT